MKNGHFQLKEHIIRCQLTAFSNHNDWCSDFPKQNTNMNFVKCPNWSSYLKITFQWEKKFSDWKVNEIFCVHFNNNHIHCYKSKENIQHLQTDTAKITNLINETYLKFTILSNWLTNWTGFNENTINSQRNMS